MADMLTASQLAALKADIGGQSSLTADVAAANWPAIAAFYNAPSSPAVTVWRADVKPSEIVAAITGSEFVALTAIKQSLLSLLLMPGAALPASKMKPAATSRTRVRKSTLAQALVREIVTLKECATSRSRSA